MGKISFFLKEAFGSLRRNYFMTIAAFVTVFLSILVLGGVLVFVFMSDALLAEVEEKVEITVYLKSDPDPEPDQITAMESDIISWTEVKECVFVSKSDALERMKEWFADNPEVLDNLSGNPLPASFEITLADPQTVDIVAARFKDNPIVDEVKYGEEIADKLFAFTNQARNFMLIFIVLLGVVAILLISNTIRLSIFARKREVEIMKLVGATNWFIRWPFLIEGVTVGLFGALAATVVVLVLNTYLLGKVRDSIAFLTVPLDAVPYVLVAAVLLGVGVVIGAVGSAIGLRRFLKV
jgi:cell division transport system permease protein